MNDSIRSAYSTNRSAEGAAAELIQQWDGMSPVAIAFFCSHHHDGARLSAALKARYPTAANVGCTTAGEFSQRWQGRGGVSAVALGATKVRRAAAALASFDGGVGASVKAAIRQLSSTLDVDIRSADPKRYVGLTLIEGLRMKEEACNDALGNEAPLLSFVGGSAGDDGEFKRTRVFADGAESEDGAALLLLDSVVPFVVGKACSFEPTGTVFTVTRANAAERIVYELDGKPVADVYARAVGVDPSKLDGGVFMTHPVGLVIDGAPWIRSPQQILADGGLRFYCNIEQGMSVNLMRSTDLIEDTRASIARSAKELGRPIEGGVVFNCILRRLEIDAKGLAEPFLATLEGKECAGFHTYGESWLAHINQTLTAVWFG